MYNKFTGEDAMDGVSVDGSNSGANIVYLTRADFKGTFPTAVAKGRVMTENVADLNLYTAEDTNAFINEWYLY